MCPHRVDTFPFRLGTTSYVIPADIISNVRELCGRVDDVELVLFESEEMSNLPGPEEIEVLRAVAAENALTYTVHLPLDTELGDPDEDVRQTSVEKCVRVMEITGPLDPFGYVVHLHRRSSGESAEENGAWCRRVRRSLQELIRTGVEPGKLAVETLDYPFDLVEGVIADLKLSVCLDIGHILLYGRDLDAHLDRYVARTLIVHLHGLRDGKDHLDLSHLPAGVLETIVGRISLDGSVARVLTIEVFNLDQFEKSMNLLEEIAL